jgi:hypothetical protein
MPVKSKISDHFWYVFIHVLFLRSSPHYYEMQVAATKGTAPFVSLFIYLDNATPQTDAASAAICL